MIEDQELTYGGRRWHWTYDETEAVHNFLDRRGGRSIIIVRSGRGYLATSIVGLLVITRFAGTLRARP
jgi:hypothetical protein